MFNPPSAGRNSPSTSSLHASSTQAGPLYNLDSQRTSSNPKTHTIPMNTLESLSIAPSWEDLRRKARHIEQDLDVKLVSFAKLGSSSSSSASRKLGNLDFDSHDHHKNKNSSSDDPTSNDDMFRTMAMEINTLLNNLQTINQQLSDFSNNDTNHNSYLNPGFGSNEPSSHASAAKLHTLQRHRDILQDFQHEFNKIKSNIEAQRQREDLLGSVRRDIDMHYRQQQQMKGLGMGHSDFDNSNLGPGGSGEVIGGGISAQSQSFMNERARLLNSDKMTQEAIQMGLNTRDALREQRAHFTGMTSKMQGIMQKFPMINSLVHRVNWRKKRDSLIMAGVISVCVFLLLVYWMRSG